MTRAMTLADVLGQLNNDASTSVDLSTLLVINEYVVDTEGCTITTNFKNFKSAYRPIPYDVNIIQDGCPVGYWRLNDFGNLLSITDQSFDSPATVGTWVATNSAIANSTTQAKDGTHSLKVTASAANAGATTGFYQVIPNQVYTGSCWIFATGASKTFTMTITWYTAAKASISSQVSATLTATQNVWTQLVYSGNAPSNALYMELTIKGVNAVNTDVYYMDVVTLMQFGYDSTPLGLSPGFQKNPATSVGANTQILPAQNGPYKNPDATTFSGACQFTTVNDQLSIPSSTQLQITGNLTLELWVNTNGQLSGSNATLYGLLSKSYAEFGLDLYGDGTVGFSFTGASPLQTASGVVPNTNSWHHIVATRQTAGRPINIYVDGVLQAGGNQVNTPSATSNPVTIGKSSAHNTLAGMFIAEVAVYGRWLSATQVANHYAWATSAGTVGSGWGISFNGGANTVNQYGQYGYAQYPTFVAPGPVYDGGAVYGVFTWG